MEDSKKVDSKPLYAAIHFYDEKSRHITIVQTTTIKDFDPNDTNNYSKSHYVERLNCISGEIEFAPAQIHLISDNIQALENPDTRYKYIKKRASDAVRELKSSQSNNKTEEVRISINKLLVHVHWYIDIYVAC